MPSGSSKTGRKTPKTAGSGNEGDDTVLSGNSGYTGVPAATADLIRRQRIHQEQAIPRNPHTQTHTRITGNSLAAGVANTGGEIGEAVNGRPTLLTTESRPDAAVPGTGRHRMLSPSPTSRENGTRNLHIATSQTACLTRAGFLRSARVSKPATTAKSVDCHK